MPAMLQFTDLTLRRGPRILFEHASLQIHAGQKVGVTGANGSGKSSLLALILDELHADSGAFERPAQWTLAHVAQEMPAGAQAAIDYVLDGDAELRAVEQALAEAQRDDAGDRLAALHDRFEAIDGYTARSRAGQLLHGLGFGVEDEARPVGEFSGGWRMRLNLARALMCRSDLLLLDEPTNHLDLDAVIWLENWLRAYPGTLLLISHDREFLDAVTTHIISLEQQRATLYKGNYSAFERVRAERLAGQQAAYLKQQREIAHMHAYIDRFRAKATKARQAQSRLKALQRMEQIAPAHVDSPFRFQMRAPESLPDPLLRMEGAAAGYDGRWVISDLSLDLSPGDRIGLLGPNGAGKSTLIRLLAGELAPQQGRRLDAQDLSIGYFAQYQLEQLRLDRSPLQHLQALDAQAREQALRDYLGSFGFSGDQSMMAVEPFSGGEKSRLVLALLVYRRPNLLLLDEPTNHLDLEMRQALARALQEFDGAMVLVSHDRHLLRVCCDRLLLVHGGAVEDFPGGLDDYAKWLRDHNRPSQAAPEQDSPAHSAGARKEKKRAEAAQRRRLQPLRQQVSRAEEALARLHARQTELERRLTDPDLYAEHNKERLKTLLREKAEVDGTCERLEADWLAACEQLEAMQQ
jgi:ATP-binding cassette subfamily F protein 3